MSDLERVLGAQHVDQVPHAVHRAADRAALARAAEEADDVGRAVHNPLHLARLGACRVCRVCRVMCRVMCRVSCREMWDAPLSVVVHMIEIDQSINRIRRSDQEDLSGRAFAAHSEVTVHACRREWRRVSCNVTWCDAMEWNGMEWNVTTCRRGWRRVSCNVV